MVSPFDDEGIVFGQGGFFEADAVEFFLLESDRGMRGLGGSFLVEDIFDVVCAVGMVEGGSLDGLDKCVGAVFVFEGEEFFEGFLERFLGGRKVFEVGLGLLSETDKGLDLVGLPESSFLLEGRFPVGWQFDPFSVLIGAGVGGDGFFFEVDGEGLMVSLDDDLFAHGPWGHGVGVSIEADGEIGVDLCRGGIPAIGQDLGEGS
jgi:hypothetical protein